MKKYSLLLIFTLLPLLATADSVKINGIVYELIGNTAKVVANIAPDYRYVGDIDIPETITYENMVYRVTSIGDDAFFFCTNMTSVVIPNSVTTIGKEAFIHCESLTSVTIPNSVKTINHSAFAYCTSLKSVNLGNGLTSVDEMAFLNCTSLTSVVIPSSLTYIGDGMFHTCTSLTSVVIPTSVTYIANNAFMNCSSLSSVNIPNSVTYIGGAAFQRCSSLVTVTIPYSVKTIYAWAFQGCSGLTSVIIGSGTEQIGNYAFGACSRLTDVVCYAEKVPDTRPQAFESTPIENATLHVPVGSAAAYRNSEPWKYFKWVDEFEGSGPGFGETKCAQPTISYKNGRLTFSSATEGAECVATITDSDIKTYHGNEIDLTVTYIIKVYATKSGYDNSDVATATLCWIDTDPMKEGIENGIVSLPALALLIQNHDGVLTVEGAAEGAPVSVYALSGQMVGFARANSGTTHVNTSLHSGEVCIVKVGDRGLKVLLK